MNPNKVLDVFANISLKGEPYQRSIQTREGTEHIDVSVTALHLASDTGYVESLQANIDAVEQYLGPLFEESGFYTIDHALKHGHDLTFEQAFSLATFVVSGLNSPLKEKIGERIVAIAPSETHLLQAVSLLSAMSAKEAYRGLTAIEIAGMVAATLCLDTTVRIKVNKPIIAFGGMGGDKGYSLNGESTKLFSLSTLAAIALSEDVQTHKHHSYPNTSKIAGQSAIEAFGARSDFHTRQAFQNVLSDTNLIMTSCHDTRTLHTLSHLLRGETINHVIGPLSFTLASNVETYAMIGVNEKIHPETVVMALEILRQKDFQKYENAAVFCGTDLKHLKIQQAYSFVANREFQHAHVRIDEVAPPPYVTIASFLKAGRNQGTYVIEPEDFYTEKELEDMDLSDLVVPNERDEILKSNVKALSGQDKAKAKYLAMTIGLALFTRFGLNNHDSLDKKNGKVNREILRACTQRGLEILESGDGIKKLISYVESTNAHAGAR